VPFPGFGNREAASVNQARRPSDFGVYVSDLCAQRQKSLVDPNRIKIAVEADLLLLPSATVIPLGMIINDHLEQRQARLSRGRERHRQHETDFPDDLCPELERGGVAMTSIAQNRRWLGADHSAVSRHKRAASSVMLLKRQGRGSG